MQPFFTQTQVLAVGDNVITLNEECVLVGFNFTSTAGITAPVIDILDDSAHYPLTIGGLFTPVLAGRPVFFPQIGMPNYRVRARTRFVVTLTEQSTLAGAKTYRITLLLARMKSIAPERNVRVPLIMSFPFAIGTTTPGANDIEQTPPLGGDYNVCAIGGARLYDNAGATALDQNWTIVLRNEKNTFLKDVYADMLFMTVQGQHNQILTLASLDMPNILTRGAVKVGINDQQTTSVTSIYGAFTLFGGV